MSAEPVQELSSCQPTRKSAASFRIHSYVIRWCCSPGCFAPCPLGKFCQELMLSFLDLEIEIPRTLSSAKNPRTLRSATLVCWKLRVLGNAVRYLVRHIWLSCPHRVFLVCGSVLPVAVPKFCCVELPVDWWCVFVTFLATEVTQKQHSELVNIFISLSPILKCCCESNSTDRATEMKKKG